MPNLIKKLTNEIDRLLDRSVFGGIINPINLIDVMMAIDIVVSKEGLCGHEAHAMAIFNGDYAYLCIQNLIGAEKEIGGWIPSKSLFEQDDKIINSIAEILNVK